MAIPVKIERELSANAKVGFLFIASFVCAIAAGFLINSLFYSASPLSADWPYWLALVAALFFLVSFIGISSLIIGSKIVYSILGVSVLALIVPMLTRLGWFHLLAAVVLFVWLVASRWKIKKDLDIYVKPKPASVLRRGVKQIVGGLIIFITVFYFFSPRISDVESLFVSRSVFDAMLVPAEKAVQGAAPAFRMNMTLDEAIMAVMAGSFVQNILKSDPDMKKMTPEEFAANVESYISKNRKTIIKTIKAQLSQQLGAPLEDKGGEKVGDLFYDMSLAQFKNLPEKVKIGFGVLTAISIYFILRIIAVPFAWLVQIFSNLLFSLALAAKFVFIKTETVEREIVEI